MPVSGPLRLAEAAGVLSLGTDLAMGQPLEHGLRTAVLAVRTAAAMGLPEDERVTVFYTGVLHFAGCTAEGEIDARFFGDELAARPQMTAALFGPRLGLAVTAARAAHPERAPVPRAAAMARSAVGGMAEFRRWAASHCEVAQLLGARMGLSDEVQGALRHPGTPHPPDPIGCGVHRPGRLEADRRVARVSIGFRGRYPSWSRRRVR